MKILSCWHNDGPFSSKETLRLVQFYVRWTHPLFVRGLLLNFKQTNKSTTPVFFLLLCLLDSPHFHKFTQALLSCRVQVERERSAVGLRSACAHVLESQSSVSLVFCVLVCDNDVSGMIYLFVPAHSCRNTSVVPQAHFDLCRDCCMKPCDACHSVCVCAAE